MAPQITVLHPPACKHARKLERRGLFFTPESALYFSRRSSERRPNVPGALSRAIDCRRRVALRFRSSLLIRRAIRDAFLGFLPLRDRYPLPAHPGRLGATSLPLFHITVVSRGRGIPRLGPRRRRPRAYKWLEFHADCPESFLVIRRYDTRRKKNSRSTGQRTVNV